MLLAEISKFRNSKIPKLLLLLLLSFSLAACFRGNKNPQIAIQWEGDLATGFIVPVELLGDVPRDSISQLVKIHLAGGDSMPAVLGNYNVTDEQVVFRPLIPLTPGLKYSIRFRDSVLYEIKLPGPAPDSIPQVSIVYPDKDTLPANLLKLYIVFSRPMQEGQALEHIALIKDGHDTLTGVFLDLQPELWNNSSHMLTLWFDPGRIKRDLQPNQRLGPPLVPGSRYRLLIRNDWKAASGASLVKQYTKDFVTTSADTLSPDPEKWSITAPRAGTHAELTVDFHESLDYTLAKNAINIVNDRDETVGGTLNITTQGDALRFVPDRAWMPGDYALRVEARLEDLAGNNLNRLFDSDLSKPQKTPLQVYKRSFQIIKQD
jgi:hypothetical protein